MKWQRNDECGIGVCHRRKLNDCLPHLPFLRLKFSAAHIEVQGKDLTGKASGSAKFFGCSKLLFQLRKSSHESGDGYVRRADDTTKMA
ncbi:hypothetical protein [Fervidibacter sacchari]